MAQSGTVIKIDTGTASQARRHSVNLNLRPACKIVMRKATFLDLSGAGYSKELLKFKRN